MQHTVAGIRRQRRRHALAIRGEAHRQPVAGGKGRAGEVEVRGAPEVEAGERQLVMPGAHAGERGAKPVGDVFEHKEGERVRDAAVSRLFAVRHDFKDQG